MTKSSSYHHGDLRASLLKAAMRMLEKREPFSLRALARASGVSPTAPYRHFADRAALESALAAEGFRELKADLEASVGTARSAADLSSFAVAYVDFALRRPDLFRLMFGDACDPANDERVRATAELHQLLAKVLLGIYPGVDVAPLAVACWSLAHGLAFLHLDGKLATSPRASVAPRVRAAVGAILSVPDAARSRRR